MLVNEFDMSLGFVVLIACPRSNSLTAFRYGLWSGSRWGTGGTVEIHHRAPHLTCLSAELPSCHTCATLDSLLIRLVLVKTHTHKTMHTQ